MRDASVLRAIVVVRVDPALGRDETEDLESGEEVGVDAGESSINARTAFKQSKVWPYLTISSAVVSRSTAMCEVFSYWALVCKIAQSTREKYFTGTALCG
jgi:hypothetical protein